MHVLLVLLRLHFFEEAGRCCRRCCCLSPARLRRHDFKQKVAANTSCLMSGMRRGTVEFRITSCARVRFTFSLTLKAPGKPRGYQQRGTRCPVSRLHLLEVLLCRQCCCTPRSSSCHLLLLVNPSTSSARQWHSKTRPAD